MIKIEIILLITIAIISTTLSQSKKEDGKETKARVYRKGQVDKRNLLTEADTDNEYSRSGSGTDREYQGPSIEGVSKDVWGIAGNETSEEMKQKKWNGNDEDTKNNKKYVNTAIIGSNNKVVEDDGRLEEGEDRTAQKNAQSENQAVDGKITDDLKNTDNPNFNKYKDKVDKYEVVDTQKLITQTKNEPYSGDGVQKPFWDEDDMDESKKQRMPMTIAMKLTTRSKIRKTSIVLRQFRTTTETPMGRPGKCTDAEITDVLANRIDMKWNRPSDQGASPITGYKIECMEKWEDYKPAKDCSFDETTTTIDGLKEGTEYQCRVSAVNDQGVGEPSDPTNPVMTKSGESGKGKPRKLTGAKITDTGPNSLDMTWDSVGNDGGSPITGYQIECMETGGEFKPAKDCGPDETTTTVDGLNERTEYQCRVSAVNEKGTGEPSNVTKPAMTKGEGKMKPGAPTDLKLKPNGNKKMDFEWAKPMDDGGSIITGFEIEIKITGKKYKPFKMVGGDELTLTIDGLNDGTEYMCRVRAVNEVGPGEFSESAPASTYKNGMGDGDRKTLSPTDEDAGGQMRTGEIMKRPKEGSDDEKDKDGDGMDKPSDGDKDGDGQMRSGGIMKRPKGGSDDEKDKDGDGNDKPSDDKDGKGQMRTGGIMKRPKGGSDDDDNKDKAEPPAACPPVPPPAA